MPNTAPVSSCFRIHPLKIGIQERFGPRIGSFALGNSTLDSPGIIASTSRGVVPHLSRDHYETKAIRWVNLPFETFLERRPPVPTLQQGSNPLHTFLGFERKIVTMMLRDPRDCREMPTNGNTFISANCLQGVRKVSPEDWRTYTLTCNPDFVVALADTPFTVPPFSQKRLTKGNLRSAQWISDLIQADAEAPLRVLVSMAGDVSLAARRAFSDSLLEEEAEKPFKCMDDRITGYTFDLEPLYRSLDANKSQDEVEVVSLLQASLSSLPTSKPRFVNSCQSPHEMLRLIQNIGIDMFDAHWAQHAADIGIALDFVFPAKDNTAKRRDGRCDLGHNLYETRYAHDFSPVSDSFRGQLCDDPKDLEVCICAACSPISPGTTLSHSSLDGTGLEKSDVYQPPFTRAYLHHLLNTHEMSAHSLLVMHNLTVLDVMFRNVRSIIADSGPEVFAAEVERFVAEYDEKALFEEAALMWKQVDLDRGKGRLSREKQQVSN
ncbi:tRNA-guanine(15) transglycosylase-like protein [Mycena floridula]|nr:tRNA-guanine(15) transglycosylase-like protein [Mycena floridula]